MPKISRIEPKTQSLKRLKRVAAYARVSMQTERTMNSLSAQISYYNNIIQQNPEWEFAGVYADDFISGTDTVKRDEFNRLLNDSKDGNIDIILTKSISRFARNTIDLLETVRMLKDIGVEVRFEKENINSLSGDGELMLSILASFAQEESRTISDNVKWGIRKRMEEGVPNGRFNVYGYRWEGDTMVIIPEEAEIVKRIFQNFLDGKSRLETEREFEAEGITTRNGCRWVDSNIKGILTNVTYTGNLLLQKEFIEDPITKHRKKNKGQLPQYFVEDTHPAIIDKITFDYVQEEIAKRKELGCFANKSLNITCFTAKMKCGDCGKSMVRDTRKNRANISRFGEYYSFWICTSSKRKGGGRCKSGAIREEVLKEECAKALGLDEFDERIFAEKISSITIPQKGILLLSFYDGRSVLHKWESNYKKESWTPERRQSVSEYRRNHTIRRYGISCFTSKIKCALCGNNFRKATQKAAGNTKVSYWRCAGKKDCNNKGLRDDWLRVLTADILGLEVFDETEFLNQIERISVSSDKELAFHFYDGRIINRLWEFKRPTYKWLEEQRAKFKKSVKKVYTPERRRQMSENMKKLRKERGANWRKEK